jgi:translation initiation factor IF-2
MLEPKFEDHLKGTVEIREMFKIPKVGNVAGCYITDGEVERGNLVRVIRDGSIIFNSKIASLHRFKEDVKKVATGYECGVRVENYQDLNKGDILEVYEKREV